MGKGDKKSKKGKITIGSYGVKRPRKKKVAAAKAKAAPKKIAKAAAPKKAGRKTAKKED
ncbi:MAG TPA: 30S ribosomal protein THX [Bacteroidia bacterium]|jgi:30S ribosomal protein S31|nr:30S ribosomal protein THX [Bacteroidia bacterium]